MEQDRTRAELYLKIIAWLAIVGGSLSALAGLGSGLALLASPMEKFLSQMPNASPEAVATIQGQMRLAWLVAFIMAPIRFAAVVAGIGMLKRKSWARTLMEVLIWIFIASSVANTWYFTFAADTMGNMFNAMGKNANPGFANSMSIGVKVMATFTTAIWCSALGAANWFLRRPGSRAFFKTL